MTKCDKNGGPNHLKAWRIYRGLSQEDLAEAVGTNQNQIAYLESGERGLSAKWLRKLSVPLKTNPGHILEHDPTELPADIVEIWMTADDEQKRQIVKIIKAVVMDGTNG